MTKGPKPRTVVHIKHSGLSELLDRPGGLARQQAIAQATKNVEAMRGTFIETLGGLIDRLCLVAEPGRAPNASRLAELEALANQVITLAGTYGFAHLTEATMRLCDLLMALSGRNIMLEDALALHVQAVRLFSPANAPMTDDAANMVLQELRRVLVHFRIGIGPSTVRTLPTQDAAAKGQKAAPAARTVH